MPAYSTVNGKQMESLTAPTRIPRRSEWSKHEATERSDDGHWEYRECWLAGLRQVQHKRFPMSEVGAVQTGPGFRLNACVLGRVYIVTNTVENWWRIVSLQMVRVRRLLI